METEQTIKKGMKNAIVIVGSNSNSNSRLK